MASAIDATKPVAGSPTTQSVRDNFAAAKSEIELLQQTAGVGPQGPIGPQGNAGTVDVGTVTTSAAGSSATITAAGTPTARILNFTIPRGDTGAGGGGITETQAVNAVRQGQVRFEEATVTTAPAFPTSPNVATTAPVLGAGWTAGADAILGPFTYAATSSSQSALGWPINFAAGDVFQIVFTMTTTRLDFIGHPHLYLRNGAATSSNQQTIATRINAGTTITVRAERAYTHLVLEAGAGPLASTLWGGTFTLTRVVKAVTVNSSVFNLKDNLVTVRDNGDMFIGNGGKSYTGTSVGFECTSLGVNSLGGISSANSNTAIGRDSLVCLSTGSQNVAVGFRASQNNISGGQNVALGNYCLSANQTSSNNVAVGYYAMNWPTATGSHVAVGYYALANGTVTGEAGGNVALGFYALCGGSKQPGTIWTLMRHGGLNVAVGYYAGYYVGGTTLTAGGSTESVFIGNRSRSNLDDQTNQIVIGSNAQGHGSNTITLGNDAITALHCHVQTISALSDSRVKENIQSVNLDQCLNTVKNLPVSQWDWLPIAGPHAHKHETGFLADDVAKTFPAAVSKEDRVMTVYGDDGKPHMTMVTEPVLDPQSGATTKSETRLVEKTEEIKDLQYVSTSEMLPTLWGAVQKLIQQVEELSKKS